MPSSDDERAEPRPGLHLLRVPLAGHTIGHVNVYALEADDGILLVDCAWATEETRRQLARLIARLGYRPSDVSRVLLTHEHADHSGQSGWLQDLGARIGLHPAGWGPSAPRSADVMLAETTAWLEAAGVPRDVWPVAVENATHLHERAWQGAPDFGLVDGQIIEHGPFLLEVLHVAGHTPGSVVFHERSHRVLFTGDFLYARSPFSPLLRAVGDADPMTEYLGSLSRIAELDVDVALAGHYEGFADVRGRVATVERHHLGRAALVAELAEETGPVAWRIAARIPRRRPWAALSVAQQVSATAEVFAHLARLNTIAADRYAG
ncbi:MBL fold metallo-hydrolase [Microbacterium sp. X-17]|uniref:MBL fold metallo-hydrolase n=1 Tax=Microbacterium sp. X-17 TaxID=3144404 RepID=UPI0031F5A90F